MVRCYSDAEIYTNRLAVIAYLKNPNLRKATGKLRKGRGRCCLGHMCDVLGLESVKSTEDTFYYKDRDGDWEKNVAPIDVVEKLGLHDNIGGTKDGYFFDLTGILKVSEEHGFEALSELNDGARISPQKIGAYLETVIMGGDNTPWRKLNVWSFLKDIGEKRGE